MIDRQIDVDNSVIEHLPTIYTKPWVQSPALEKNKK
jgi:hypothetical protein